MFSLDVSKKSLCSDIVFCSIFQAFSLANYTSNLSLLLISIVGSVGDFIPMGYHLWSPWKMKPLKMTGLLLSSREDLKWDQEMRGKQNAVDLGEREKRVLIQWGKMSQ